MTYRAVQSMRSRRAGLTVPVVLLLATLAPGDAAAEEAEYRSFKLSDGRVMVGLVVETGAEGMAVRVPQGIATVPYGLLSDIGVTDADAANDQAPLVIAVAPTQADTLDARNMAAEINAWLADVVALVPHTVGISSSAWEDGLDADGVDLLGCGARIDCLAPLGQRVSADRLLLPTLELSDGVATLSLVAVVPSTATEVGRGSGMAGAIPSDHAATVLHAVFEALAVGPEIDVDATAAERFSPPPQVAEPLGTDVPASEDSDAGAQGAEAAIEPPAMTIPPGGGPDEELLRTIALGFVPVPGLNGAVNEDLPAFLAALGGGVGSAWAAVFAVGRKARTAEDFTGLALGAAYGSVVGWNQIAGLIGLAARRGGARGAATVHVPGPPLPTLTIAPLLSDDGRRGAAILLHGRF